MASISDRVGDLGDYLREQRQAARMSVRQLASLTGVSNPYLSQVERGLRKPSAEVLQQLAKGLRISAEALYIRAGILDSEGRPDVEAAIAADPALNDRQRRALLDIYASFKAENRRAAEPAPPPKRGRSGTARAGGAAVADETDGTADPGGTPRAPAPRRPRKRAATSKTAAGARTPRKRGARAAGKTAAPSAQRQVAAVDPSDEPSTDPTTSTDATTNPRT